MIGKEIHSYKIIQALGEGGMGSVFKAVHKLIPTRFVAVKLLHPALFMNETMKRKFQQEATVLANLNHPYIVRMLDYAEDSQGMYLIMEYVEGRSLDEMIRKETGPIEEGRAKKIFGKILEAFQYAHSQTPSAIIHRDIKPTNILITNSDEPRIIDFGIVKILEAENKLGATQAGTKIGTPLFMSPEQNLGKQVDNRTDIYSLGITLFHMATGKSPYLNTFSEFEIQTKIVNEPLPKAKDIYPFVSAHIQSVIDKATEKDKSRRFSNCEEFKSALFAEPAPKKEAAKINSFTSNKDNISKGEQVEISWSTNSTEPVVIDPLGTMSKSSGFIAVTPTTTTTYRLKTAGENKALVITVKNSNTWWLIAVGAFVVGFIIAFLATSLNSSESSSSADYEVIDSMASTTTDTSSFMMADTTIMMAKDTMKK